MIFLFQFFSPLSYESTTASFSLTGDESLLIIVDNVIIQKNANRSHTDIFKTITFIALTLFS